MFSWSDFTSVALDVSLSRGAPGLFIFSPSLAQTSVSCMCVNKSILMLERKPDPFSLSTDCDNKVSFQSSVMQFMLKEIMLDQIILNMSEVLTLFLSWATHFVDLRCSEMVLFCFTKGMTSPLSSSWCCLMTSTFLPAGWCSPCLGDCWE